MGGAEYQASLIVDALVKRGNYDIHYLCRIANFSKQYPGYYLHSVQSRSRLSRYSKFTDSSLLMKKLIEINPDIVYQRNGGAYTGVCAYYAKTHQKKFYWHLAHDKDVIPDSIFANSNPLAYIDQIMLNYGIRNSQTIIAQSKEQAHLLQKNYGKTPDVIIKNFHPIPDRVEKKRVESLRILWVANLNPYKQPHLCLELARRLESHKNIKIVMVGRAPGSYEALVEQLKKQKNIDYRGSLPVNEVNNLFQYSDIFINTSSQEGFPNSFIQAWMREVPVVSLSVNPDSVLTKESIGLCSKNLAQMEMDIITLADNESARLAMGRRARDYAIKSHSINNITALIQHLETESSN